MNVVVTSNRDFLMPLEVCLYSLYKNNKDVNVYFINFSVNDNDFASIRETTNKFEGCSFVVIDLPKNLSEKFVYDKNTSRTIDCLESFELSIETYGKLLIPYLLPNDIDRCLYLDADTIINKPIGGFYNTDFKENYVVGLDACGYAISPSSDSRLKSKKYFNVGVILFNLNKIREDKILSLDKIVDYIDNSLAEAKACSDEIILNKVFDDKILFEDSYKFNLAVPTLPCSRFYNEERVSRLNEAYILHYISSNKPWKEKCTLPKESQVIWKDYYNQCFNDR